MTYLEYLDFCYRGVIPERTPFSFVPGIRMERTENEKETHKTKS